METEQSCTIDRKELNPELFGAYDSKGYESPESR
jgi:hypothetical protein